MAHRSDKQRSARLDAETGAIRKRWSNRVRVALVYPNHYRVAMANLGFQTVYRLLNALAHVVCERVFLPDHDSGGNHIVSLESGRKLTEFDCIAFALSFENDYANVLTVLDKAALPLPSAQRDTSLPLVMAGGVACFLNPEPLAPFIDCFLLGEAESLLPPFFETFDPGSDRRKMLRELACNVKGTYVPAFYHAKYHESGTLSEFAPIEEVPATVQRVYTADVDMTAAHSAVLTPDTSFDNVFLIEASRGCSHGCRFCAAGYLYRPPRTNPLPVLLDLVCQGADHTSKIGLVGTAISDLPDLTALCAAAKQQDLQLGFSSLRADALNADLVGALKDGRVKTATIAPETGSERMRQVVNKGLDEQDILKATETLVSGGIPNLKLYFMVGLPTETNDDIKAIVTLVKKVKHHFLRASKPKGRMGEITVSLSCFIPKPFTPFQWSAMDEVKALKHKLKQVKTGLRKVPNVRVHADVPRWAYVQALLSRGDRRVGQLLAAAHQNKGNWPQTLKTASVNSDFFVCRNREPDELLPWDFIDHGIDKQFLWRENQRALQAKTSPPCPMDPQQCKICGVCGKDR
ncbi:MAG: radical SAM protein [Desulfobacteraceae bacterium]|jgi:radical SAM superfamily enzyme YgiQ (UPF0313 family)